MSDDSEDGASYAARGAPRSRDVPGSRDRGDPITDRSLSSRIVTAPPDPRRPDLDDAEPRTQEDR